MYFSKIFQILFIIGSTFLFFSPECLYNFSVGVFSSSFSGFEDRRRLFLHIYPFSLRFEILVRAYPLKNCFQLWQIFSSFRSNSRVFAVCYSESISSGLFIFNFQLAFSKSYRCFVQVFCVDHILSLFQIPSHAGAPINHSLLSIQLFRSAEDISEDSSFHSQFTQVILRMLSHSSHLIQPAQSHFQVIISTVFLLSGP